MAHLTSGIISYERRVKTGDYEHKHATATLSCEFNEGDDANQLLALAGSLVTQHVFKILMAKATDPVAPVQPAVGPALDLASEPAPEEAALVEVILPLPTNLKSAKRRIAKDKKLEERLGPAPEVPKDDPDVLFQGDVDHAPVLIDDGTKPEIVEDFIAAAPPVTDAELQQALSRVNSKLQDKPRIYALIGEFVKKGDNYTMIPTVRRAEFISKLEALA